MAKCIRCGGSFLTRSKHQLKDGLICGKCLKELGFDKEDIRLSQIYSYDEIKDGLEVYYKKQQIKDEAIGSVSVSIQNHGQERDLICTEEERSVYDYMARFLKDINADVSPLQLVRVSDDYVTAKYGEWDLARIKYTNRAKWVKFPTVEAAKEKHGIEKPDDVLRFHQLIIESINHIEKYS